MGKCVKWLNGRGTRTIPNIAGALFSHGPAHPLLALECVCTGRPPVLKRRK
jgi:hypothetical protein